MRWAMLDEVKRAIRSSNMLQHGEAVHVAVSGGVDSMVLLHVLRSLGYSCSVAHVDHGLRGIESTGDRDFIEEYCSKHNVPFRSVEVDVRSRLEEGIGSVQMAARELRYAWFEALHAEEPMPVALGHHQDDATETLFINLLRGTGLHGWASIPPISGFFVRPLLGVNRAAILAYATQHQIPFREDSSNTDPKYLRNRIRHELLPMLEDLRPGALRAIGRSVVALRELQSAADRSLIGELSGSVPEPNAPFCLLFDRIEELPSARVALDLILRPLGFHPSTIERIGSAITERSTGAVFRTGNWFLCIDRSGIIVEREKGEFPRYIIDQEGVVQTQASPFQWRSEKGPVPIPAGMHEVVLDADKLEFPVELRPWFDADRIRPIGLAGSKLVSDILIDAKVPMTDKAGCYVLTSGDEVVWVVGHRLAEGFSAGPLTDRVLRIRTRE